MPEKSIEILGVRFDNFSLEELIGKVEKFCRNKKQGYFCTPNPEILLYAQKDPAYRQILNCAEVNIADGVGILWAYYVTKDRLKIQRRLALFGRPPILRNFYLFMRLFFRSIFFIIKYWGRRAAFEKKYLRRVTGVDLLREICINCDEKVFLLGGAAGVAQKTAEVLKKIGAKADFAGFSAASSDHDSASQIVDEVVKSAAKILFVAFGAPKQEEWIVENLAKMPDVRLAIGVGGSFDFISGHVKRAPTLLGKLGLEWLYRLFCERWRIRRIYNAVIVFPLKIWKNLLI